MLCDLMDLLACPDAHACVWRDGELYIEPVAGQATLDADAPAAA